MEVEDRVRVQVAAASGLPDGRHALRSNTHIRQEFLSTRPLLAGLVFAYVVYGYKHLIDRFIHLDRTFEIHLTATARLPPSAKNEGIPGPPQI